MLVSTAAVLSSTGMQQEQHLPNSAMIYSPQDNVMMANIADGAASFKKDKNIKRKRAEQRQMRQQMARHEIILDDPFMTGSINIGTEPVNNYFASNNHHWGWEHHSWN
jgi:hypothetical protein